MWVSCPVLTVHTSDTLGKTIECKRYFHVSDFFKKLVVRCENSIFQIMWVIQKCLGGMPRMRNKRWKRRQSQSLKRREGKRGGRRGRGGQKTRGAK